MNFEKENGYGHILGESFTNSSGHPGGTAFRQLCFYLISQEPILRNQFGRNLHTDNT
jgi:hypothetical protein